MSESKETSWGYELIVPEKSHEEEGKKVVDREKKVVAFVAGGLEHKPVRGDVLKEHAAKLAQHGIDLSNVEEVVFTPRPFCS